MAAVVLLGVVVLQLEIGWTFPALNFNEENNPQKREQLHLANCVPFSADKVTITGALIKYHKVALTVRVK